MNRLVWHNGSTWLRSPHPLPDEVLLEYFHVDALGSVRATTNLGGLETGRLDYLPFGEGPGTTGAGDKVRFAGEERDAESYLDYFGARYYRNVTGRFAAVDPVFSAGAVTRPQAWNRYAYALNGPLRFTDPTGREAEDKTGPRFLQSEAAPSAFSLEEFNAWADGYVWANEYIDQGQLGLYRNSSDISSAIEAEELGASRDALVSTTVNLSNEVDAGRMTSLDAIDQYYLAAVRLAGGVGERALLLAAGAAIHPDVLGPRGNKLTRPSLGQDTLHHFFTNALNVFRRGPIGTAAAYYRNISVDSGEPLDQRANLLGGAFGYSVLGAVALKPVVAKPALYELRLMMILPSSTIGPAIRR